MTAPENASPIGLKHVTSILVFVSKVTKVDSKIVEKSQAG